MFQNIKEKNVNIKPKPTYLLHSVQMITAAIYLRKGTVIFMLQQEKLAYLLIRARRLFTHLGIWVLGMSNAYEFTLMIFLIATSIISS